MEWIGYAFATLWVLSGPLFIFYIMVEEEHREKKSIPRAILSATFKVVLIVSALVFIPVFLSGFVNGDSSEEVCGYPWDC